MAKYSTFSFDKFEIDRSGGRLLFYYSFDDKLHFTHELNFEKGLFGTGPLSKADKALGAVFALGMAEIPSYYKLFCPPKIIIRAGALNSEQISFWKTLYEKGLGEFFYKNKIDFRDLVNIEVGQNAPTHFLSALELEEGKYLVPIGGGKDSLVSGEMLSEKGKEFSWFVLEPPEFVSKLVEPTPASYIEYVGREVPKNFGGFAELIEKEGAYNGHVPITAVYMFSATLTAILNEYSNVVLSIEKSAEEGNLTYLGSEINHQYSKTFEFEKATHDYIKKYIHPQLNLFSLLRNLYEVQIFERFSKFEKYFPYFISCNRGLKEGRWCGECAKCAFVFMGLSAFLPFKKVLQIFGKNLFEDPSLTETFKELVGRGAQKPFDCVGTYEENTLLLWMSKQNILKEGIELPNLFSEIDVSEGEKYKYLLTENSGEHLIPKDLL